MPRTAIGEHCILLQLSESPAVAEDGWGHTPEYDDVAGNMSTASHENEGVYMLTSLFFSNLQ